MSKRSEIFGRLLKAGIASIVNCEGKTAVVVEGELAQDIGRGVYTIQRYKAGYLPPEGRTVEILATACVRRGFLDRTWLQKLLMAAHYPAVDSFLEQLTPQGPPRQRPQRVYENLPAPTYSRFVMRAAPFADVVDGLGKRSAAVLLIGLGGSGKTCLAREIVAHCLHSEGSAPRFDAAVWVSDKDRPGTTNLSTVLDEIARTLDYPGFTQFAFEEKRYEVEQLLRRQRVLLVIDNGETITDGALLSWLLNLPEPSKALVTTREYRREYRRSCWPVDLRGMNDGEAWDLVNERLVALRLDRIPTEHALLESLVAATGGNPKAIELTLGLVKYERRPLQHIVDDLHTARGELFDDLFTRAWALLDEAVRRVLLSATFFPASASADSLSATADVPGYAFDRAVERLSNLALLDTQQVNLSSESRYSLHPLVKAFGRARLAEQPEFELRARERWVAWHIQLTVQVGWCWSDIRKLRILDLEEESIYEVIAWCHNHQFHVETIRLVDSVAYFYHVRCLTRHPSIHLIAARSARELGDQIEEMLQLSLHVEEMAIQGELAEADLWLEQATTLCRSLELPEDVLARYYFACAFRAAAVNDIATEERIWRQLLSLRPRMSNVYLKIASTHWLALHYYRRRRLLEAQPLFLEALADATRYTYQRSIGLCQIYLAAISLHQGALEDSESLLQASEARAQENGDQRHIALIQQLVGRQHIQHGNLVAAHGAFIIAADLFERLGMRRELAEVRAELRELGILL